MSVRIHPDEPERPVDLTTLTEDDMLLDQLGRGEIVTDAGEVEAMLSGWRASLPQPRPADRRLVTKALVATKRRSRARRLARVTLGVAITAALAGGGVTAAAVNADPDSPLWPITQFVYRDLAESRLAALEASRAVADAEDALDHGRPDQASRLLDRAATRIREVGDPAAADRLRTRLDTVRAQLPAEVGEAPPLPGGLPTSARAAVPPPPAAKTPPVRTPEPALPSAPTPTPTPRVSTEPTKPPPEKQPSLPSLVPSLLPGPGLG